MNNKERLEARRAKQKRQKLITTLVWSGGPDRFGFPGRLFPRQHALPPDAAVARDWEAVKPTTQELFTTPVRRRWLYGGRLSADPGDLQLAVESRLRILDDVHHGVSFVTRAIVNPAAAVVLDATPDHRIAAGGESVHTGSRRDPSRSSPSRTTVNTRHAVGARRTPHAGLRNGDQR